MAWLDPLLGILLLLPAAWLALPGTLSGQLEPEIGASGWWVLLQLAPALAVMARTPRPKLPLVTLFAAFVAFSLVSQQFTSSPDTLSSSRTILCAIASLSALGAGAALGQAGRRVFVIGMVAISVGLSLGALLGVSPRMQGALQNSGATSEAALLGALAALVLLANSTRRAVAILAVVTVGAYGAFVALAPVLTGGAIFAVAALLLWFIRRHDRRRVALGALVFALTSLGAWTVARTVAQAERASKSTPEIAAPSEQASVGHLGGLGVRLAIAPRTLAMFADHPWLGVGPGQFRAEFPAYRDPAERAQSNRAAGDGVETEVEHGHNDALTTLAEVGVFGGAAWLGAMLWLGWLSLRTLTRGEPERAALALALLGILINTLLRAPLSFNPACASLYFAAAGALIARDDNTLAPGRLTRGLPFLILVLLAISAPRAVGFMRHGRALRAPDAMDPVAAMVACADSPLALAVLARRLDQDSERADDARELWQRVLQLRPQNHEALVQGGVLAARAGDHELARALWQRARELATDNRTLAHNLLLLDARTGSDAQFEATLAAVEGVFERPWAETAGAKELLGGDERAAARLWRAAGSPWIDEIPEQLFERARVAPEGRSVVENAWEFLAHVRWAREHAATGAFAASVRSYRQALRLGPGSRTIRLEFAAALWIDGKHEDARQEVERAKARAEDWTRLPPWAGDALLQAGLLLAPVSGF